MNESGDGIDIIAIQEVKGYINCQRETIKIFANEWSFIIPDVTKGASENNEHFAFIFNGGLNLKY